MKVDNHTAYPTRLLKALLVETYRRSWKYGTRVPQWGTMVVVHVIPSRTKYDCQPSAHQPVHTVRTDLDLTIPAKEADPLRIVKEFEAGLVWLDQGVRNTYPHDLDSVLQDKTPWADIIVGGGFVPHRPHPPPQDAVAARYERVQTRLVKWRARLKKATTMVKKLERQQRYYEKRRPS